MAVAGLALTFAPEELLSVLGTNGNPTLTLFAQLTGALYVGFAILNWMARESTIGGIYNRPLLMGNLTHFVVGALALLKAATKLQASAPAWVAAGIYTIFAIGFGTLFFRSPRPAD
jgi:hypothetical protein